tara:strand:+ start:2278 stop:4044 length:1767 start_codon:yes stop_codon:yes gene_type:complete
MTGKVAELQNVIRPDNLANSIIYLYDAWRRQRKPWVEENLELRNFIFATDTTKTTNQNLPWKNSTTLPKLTQIRDNLHANYMSALFPNDDWLKWEAYTLDGAEQEKKEAIQAYMSNKTRESNFQTTVSQLVLDYIDYGNAFADSIFVNESREDPVTGEPIPGYIGPKAVRISPLDHVINPTATSYENSPKFTRSVKTLGELKVDAEDFADHSHFEDAIKKSETARDMAVNRDGLYTIEDFEKASGYSIDGFGDLKEYYQSPFVEIIEIEGDIHDPVTGILLRNHVITIIDRAHVIRKEPIPSWLGKSSKAHVGWRLRPDNLYAMGPLHNLVGMQYRIDHLENLKADVFDLIAFPPLKIKGEVEEFDWAPGAEIHIDEEGDVEMLVPDTTALNADNQIALLEQRMEEFAGAPKQAMGVRTPGEKTAFEVQALENAAGRIFQEKITNFEINLLEPLLNSMLETSRRNMDGGDVVRVMDDDLGVEKFRAITREDITAKGKIRPVGARHFAARAQLMQNLQGVFSSPMGQTIAPHISPKALAKLVEDTMGLNRFALVQDNVAVMEAAETQRLMGQIQEDLQVESETPLDEDV